MCCRCRYRFFGWLVSTREEGGVVEQGEDGLQGGGDSIEGLQTASFGGGELDGLLTPTNIAIAAIVAGGLFYWATS